LEEHGAATAESSGFLAPPWLDLLHHGGHCKSGRVINGEERDDRERRIVSHLGLGLGAVTNG
jgi:hypothetical protein